MISGCFLHSILTTSFDLFLYMSWDLCCSYAPRAAIQKQGGLDTVAAPLAHLSTLIDWADDARDMRCMYVVGLRSRAPMDVHPGLPKWHLEPWGLRCWTFTTAELMSPCGSMHVLLPHSILFLCGSDAAQRTALAFTEMMLDQQ